MLGWLRPGPPRELRLQQTSALLARHGYVARVPEPDVLAPYLPWPFETPERVHVEACGRHGDASIRIYEYGYSYTDSDGDTHHADELVVVAAHPGIRGGAWIRDDAPRWGGVAAAIDAILWMPPFVVARGLAWAIGSLVGRLAPVDLEVGHPDFDHFYKVHGQSAESARLAVTPALREHLLHTRFRGTLDLRAGLVVYTVAQASYSPTHIGIALGHLSGLLRSVAIPASPYR